MSRFSPMLIETIARAVFEAEQDLDDPLDRWPLISNDAAAPYLRIADYVAEALRVLDGPWCQFREGPPESDTARYEAALRKIAGFNFPSMTPGYIAREALGWKS